MNDTPLTFCASADQALTRYGGAMSGIPAVALDSNMGMAVLVLEGVGSLCWAGGAAVIAASRSFGRAQSRWVDRGAMVSFGGMVTTLVGALAAGNWPLAFAAVAMAITFQLLREQRPERPDRRLLLGSFSGLLARAGFRLSRDKQTYAAAVVRVERGNRSHRYSLPQIREELVGAILDAAEHDVELDDVLNAIASEIEATVHGVARIDARPGSARYRMATYAKINDFANSVLDQATEPDAHRAVRPCGYSATMLKLAAASRLADRSVSAHAGA